MSNSNGIAIPPNLWCPIVGDYTSGLIPTAQQTAAAITADRLYTNPFLIDRVMTFDRIAACVTVASGGGTLVRLGIYRSTNNAPSALLLDAGTILADSAHFQAITINQQLTPGLYFLSMIGNSTPTMTKMVHSLNVRGYSSTDTPGNQAVYLTTQAYGALPNPHTTPVLSGSAVGWMILLRTASVP